MTKKDVFLIKAMLGMLGGGENICGWVFMMELLPLVSLHKKMTEAGTQTELFVILMACLFSFVAGEHEMQPSGTCYHPDCHCRWKILLILRNLNKKQVTNTKKILFFVGKQGILAGT